MTAYMTSTMTRSMSEMLTRVNGNKSTSTPPTKVEPGKYELLISLIKADGGTQPRAMLSNDTISEYATDMDHGELFPPVTVFYDGSIYWLADGFHRLAAVKRLGHRNIWAEVKQGTRRDAVLYSAGANSQHGLRRTDKDKHRAVELLLNDSEWSQWSNREIARRCAVSSRFVDGLRHEVTANNAQLERTYTTKHGTKATMDTGKIGKGKPKKEPTPAAQATAQDIVNTTFNQAVDKLALALTDAEPETVAFVTTHNMTNPERVEIMKRLAKSSSNPGSNKTYNEILSTGGFHYGDNFEKWCDFVNDPIQVVQRGLDSVAEHHRQMAINEKLAVQPAPEPTTASPFTASVEWRDGSYHAVIVMSGYKTEHAAMKAIKEVQSMLTKEQVS